MATAIQPYGTIAKCNVHEGHHTYLSKYQDRKRSEDASAGEPRPAE